MIINACLPPPVSVLASQSLVKSHVSFHDRIGGPADGTLPAPLTYVYVDGCQIQWDVAVRSQLKITVARCG